MNEQAIQDSYNVFVSQGYTKSIDEFKKLINTNPQALKDSYDVFVNNGYSKSIDDYKALMGVSSKPAPVSKKKVSSESVAPQKPQTPTTESLSEDGLSVTPPPIKIGQKFSKAELREQPMEVSRDATFVKIPQIKTPKREFIEQEKQAVEKKKYGEIFDKQVGAKPKPSESSYLKERLKSIDTDLINYEQDYIVPELEYQFGDLGFKFEESGIIGDYVKVTAPNNKTIEISADNLFSSKSKEQADILKKFIAENTPAKGLFVIENTMREQDVKFNSQKQVDESIKSITNDVNLLSQKQKEILERKAKLDKDIEDFNLNPSQERLNILQQQKAQLDEDVKKVLQEESSIQSKGLRLNQAVAKYGMSKARQGSWYGGIWDSFNRGVGKMSSGVTSLVADIAIEAAPTQKLMSEKDLKTISIDIAKKIGIKGPSENQTIDQWKATLTEDQLDEWEDQVDDYAKKDVKGKILPYIRIGAEEIFGDPSTTKQWADLKKEGFWGGAILGVAESLPAMIGGGNVAGWAQRTAQMYAQISDGLSEEMENDPDFKNITENEKLAITLPIGITSAVLEAYGLRNVMASKGVINSIALRAMGKAGVGTSAKTFRELVQNEVDGMVAKGLLTITAAGVAEFETGAAQELTETGYKIIYDKLKEKDMFNTPDSKLDLVENVLVAGAQEAVGGFLLGIPSGVSVAYSKKGFLAMDDTTFETFASMANDTNIQSAYIASLKQKITQGLITQKEAKEQLNDYRNSVGLYRQLPEGLTTQQKKEAMNLLKEKRDLENFVEGKDPALVVKAKNRITEINDSLTKLSETDAVQEQSTTEVPVQSETGISETMEGRTPEAEPQVITEQVVQEEVINPLADVESTANALNEDLVSSIEETANMLFPKSDETNNIVAEAYHQAKQDGSNPELVDAVESLLTPEVKTEAAIGVPDEVSQPIELSVTPEVVSEQVEGEVSSRVLELERQRDAEIEALKAKRQYDEKNIKPIREKYEALILDEKSKEQAPAVETPVETTAETAPAEEKFIIDGKEYTKEEAIEKSQQNSRNITYGSKMEYNGNDAQAKEFVDRYNEESSPYFRDGRLKGVYIKQELLKAMNNMSFRKFGNLYRKHIDPYFSRASNEKSVGGYVGKDMTFEELAGYIIGDSNPDTFEEKDFRAFAKEAGIDIPELRIVETKAEVTPVETINLEQITKNSYVDRISRNIIEKIGNNWVVKTEVEGKELFKSKTLKGAKEFVSNDNQEALRVQPTETKAEVAPAETAPVEELNDLLDVDTKDENGLKRVYDFLDGLDTALDLGPNELNDVTRVMAIATAKAVVKTLKALINAGITLQEAIERAAEAFDIKSEQIIDALDIVSKINENKSEGISEMELPGYNKLSKVIDSAIKAGKTIDNILSYMERSEVYKNATDVQKELLVREVRKKFGLREKSAPSVGKLFGKIKDIKKITMTEKDALIKQLKDTAKGARQSIQEWKKQTQSLAKDLAELKKSGKITVSQETAILNKFAKVNIFSEKSVSRFTDYMTKVFADADYKAKLSTARKTLASIKKLAKNKEKNADLRAVASEFVKIDPSLVDNIDEYNIISKKIKEAIEGSKIRKADTKIAETINIENTAVYIEKALAKQEVKLREEKINELQDLLDVDASTFSAEEIDNLLDIYGEEKSSSVIKDNEKIIRAAVKKAFDIYSTVIKEMLSTGVDPFTGEDVEFTDSQRKIIKEFMGIDLNTVSDNKDALRIVDSLINFIQNKSTAGMSKSIADYQAIVGGNELIRQKIEGKGIRKLWSKSIGKTLAEQFTSLNLLFEKEFKGFNVASKVRKMMGITDLVNGKSIGQSQSNQIVKKYVERFYNKTANGEAFNSAYNDIERGVFAHVYRNVIGTEQRKKAVFEKRKQEVLEAADFLENDGNERERQLGELYRKAYNKILDGSENINDVKQKTDINNVDGVNYWVNEWANKFDALSDLALNFYNKILSRDLSYTPDRVRSLEGETKEVDLENNESAFISNTDGPLYNKKSSSLMDKQENRKIPKGMYIDLSFDSKNSNSMYDAMIDLNTAFGIRKVQSFLNSENFKKIFKDDADLFKKRISNYVRLSRRKSPYTGSELSGLIQKLDKIATIGVTQALASPTQPFKQTIPVAASTLINAGSLGMGAAFNPSYNNWLDKLGYAVSNRGIESRAEIESINRLLEKAASSKKEKAGRFIREANEKMLKWTLVNFDVWIARASFKAYYEQYLKKEGLYDDIPKKQRLGVTEIDYENHEPNDDAADYAQEMIDRQQNISDHDLAGDLFTDKNSVTKAFIKMLMAFSSFRMNQGSRLGADLTTLEYWNTSTKEDKIIALRSIAGYTAEQAVFRGLQITFGMMFYYAAKAIMGKGEDDEEDEKFKNNLIKSSATGMITDTFSPLPLLDPYIQNLSASSVDAIQDIIGISEDEKIKLFEANKQEAIKILGVYGILPERAGQVWDLGKLAYSRKFKDNYGTEKEISQEDADALKVLIGPYIASLVTGVLAPDVSSLVRKSAKIAEKRAKSIKEPVTVLQEEGAEVEKELTVDQEIEKAIKEAEEELSK